MKTRTKKQEKQGARKRSVSFPAALLVEAQARAAQDNRTFSSYLQKLVAADVEKAVAA